MAMAGVGPARSDSSIRDDVQFELKWDPKGSPTEVKENIENALRRSAEVDARRITADVDGVVRRAGASRF
jgi:osmotically-inducible protein OsmY